jgi:hypothetical protein
LNNSYIDPNNAAIFGKLLEYFISFRWLGDTVLDYKSDDEEIPY